MLGVSSKDIKQEAQFVITEDEYVDGAKRSIYAQTDVVSE